MTTIPESEDRPGHHRAADVDELAMATQQSTATMARLVKRVEDETAARDRKVAALERGHRQMQWVTVIGVSLVIILLIVGVINAWNLRSARDAQRQAAALTQQVQQTNETLLECVNGTGSCGKRNAEGMNRALDTIKQYVLTGLYCARTNPITVDPDGEKFLKCMNRLYPGGPQLDLTAK